MALIYLALAWLMGIALGERIAQPWAVCLAFALAGALTGLLMRHERAWRLGGAMVALAGLGALRLSLSPLYATPLRPYLDGPAISLAGTVAAAPDVRATRTEIVVAVDAVWREGEEPSPVRDAVLLRLPRESPSRYGYRLQVTGRVRTAPEEGGFSYRAYLARRGIHGVVDRPEVELEARGGGSPLQARLIALADRAEGLIHTLWPAPESALMAGILLGRESALPEPLLAAFDDSGTRHIIAISGFNITLLAGALTAVLLNLLNRRAAAPIVILLLAAYTLLVGADPAVVRAALMGGLTLVALLAGRPGHALNGLGLSALLMTAWNPWQLWEPSFQLSFAATLGLILLVPLLEAWVGTENDTTERSGARKTRKGAKDTRDVGPRNTRKGAKDTKEGCGSPTEASGRLQALFASFAPFRVLPWLREAVLVSLAAQLATLPITLGTFGRLSVIAPVANLLILPVQPAVMELGALATLLGLAWRPAGQLLAWLAWPFVAYTIRLVEALGRLPFAAIDLGGAGEAIPWALYGLIGAWLWLRDPARRRALWALLKPQLPTKVLLTGLVAVACLVWIGGVARLPDGRLHVTFLDVGQGDAILIQTPDGKHLLVDGGPDPNRVLAALGRRLPPWQRSLDLVALTHPDEDHLAGLVEVLRHYRVGLILDTTLPHDTPTGGAWEALTFHASRLTLPTRGTVLDLGRGARLEVLHPGETPLATQSPDNDNGLVLRLSWGKASFLLTGDLGTEGEAYLLRQEGLPLDSTVLKVAHHGAGQGTTLRFLQAVTPQVAVISAGAGNRFGHPAPEVLERLEAVGARVWRTDECGDVEIVTDGERLWVRTGR